VAAPTRVPSASSVYLATAEKGTATPAGNTEPVSVYAQSPATAKAEQGAPREKSSASLAACAFPRCVDPIQGMAAAASKATARIRLDPVMAFFIDFSFHPTTPIAFGLRSRFPRRSIEKVSPAEGFAQCSAGRGKLKRKSIGKCLVYNGFLVTPSVESGCSDSGTPQTENREHKR
jgi:hypothetical protein